MFKISLLALCLGASSANAETFSFTEKQPILGCYLEEEFMNSISKTHSFEEFYSSEKRFPESMYVFEDEEDGINEEGFAPLMGKRLRIRFGYQFHDGWNVFQIQNNHVYGRRKDEYHEPLLKIIDEKTVSYSETPAPQFHTYHYSGNCDSFISDAIIGGKYEDDNGKLYWFGHENVANIDGNQMYYTVESDLPGIRGNILNLFNTSENLKNYYSDKNIIFIRNGDILTLYDVLEVNSLRTFDPDFDKVIAKLHKISD